MGSNSLILALETATLGGSVCLAEGTTVLSSRTGDPGISHSNSLLQDINDVLKDVNFSLSAIDVFTAAAGPGSFTGLRIGLATVKALAATMGRSCVGIPTLEAIARAAGPSEATVALLPAGRGEVFVQLFSVSANARVKQLDDAAHLSPQKVFERYEPLDCILWAGEGAHVHRDLISGRTQSKWTIAPAEKNLAKHIAALGLQKYISGEVVPPELLSAVYVRPSDAELKVNVVNN
jgi:tRNA threonylcarbamoyladenosine biosynthesis protein TsaB